MRADSGVRASGHHSWALGFFLAAALLTVSPAQAETASADDTARFLAGLTVPAKSSLASLEDTPAWKAHQTAFDADFDKVEDKQLSKVREWSETTLTSHRPVLYYMFSGPDFLYANSFFPNATTYVMAGLEPPGAIPDLSKVPPASIPRVLRGLEVSLRSLLNISFFITARMQSELRASPVTGTIPVLYVFLARSGKTVRDASLVQIDENGDLVPEDAAKKSKVHGVKITFVSQGGPAQTLYYFSANLDNPGLKSNGFIKFLEKQGEGDALVKSASYLLNGGNFSILRDFLLKNCKYILQDDTGIPVNLFSKDWQLRPFGHYVAPIRVFARQYQPRLAELFRREKPKPLDFSISYRYRPNESSLLLAEKKDASSVAKP